MRLRVDVRCLTAIEPIKHGLTNDSWLVRFDGAAVVVRISNPASDRLQIDRASEAVILARCRQHGHRRAGVALRAAAAGAGHALSWPDLVARADAQQPDNIARLGATFRKLHSLQPPVGVHRVAL